MTSDSTKSLVLKLLTPNATAVERRQAVIEMHQAIYGTEPTAQQITKLEQVAARYGVTTKTTDGQPAGQHE